jgi:hypothetical protein
MAKAKTNTTNQHTAFPVRIENGGSVIHTLMHALPRKGDQIRCKFPASIPTKQLLFLRVTGVSFNQTCEFEGRECPEPFAIVITTDDVPEFKKHNADAVAEVVAEQVARHKTKKGAKGA